MKVNRIQTYDIREQVRKGYLSCVETHINRKLNCIGSISNDTTLLHIFHILICIFTHIHMFHIWIYRCFSMKLDNTPLSVHRRGNKIPGTISIRYSKQYWIILYLVTSLKVNDKCLLLKKLCTLNVGLSRFAWICP